MEDTIEKLKKASKKFLNELLSIEDMKLSAEERDEVCRHIDEVMIHGEIAKEVLVP